MAEIKDILETNDFSVHIRVGGSLGNTLTAAEIDNALASTGNPNPKMQDVTFFLSDATRTFIVSWLQGTAEYSYIKMKIAS